MGLHGAGTGSATAMGLRDAVDVAAPVAAADMVCAYLSVHVRARGASVGWVTPKGACKQVCALLCALHVCARAVLTTRPLPSACSCCCLVLPDVWCCLPCR